MSIQLVRSQLPARGVYLLSVLSVDGFPIAQAVDSKGRRAGEHVLRDGMTWEIAEALLWTLLEQVDPLPAPSKPAITLPFAPKKPAPIPAHVSLALWGKLAQSKPASRAS